MAVNERLMPLPADAVWAALTNGHSYSHWVVGTRGIRDVDQGYPGVGRRLHYTIGYGPLKHRGHTEVLEVDTGRRLVLQAHAWPVGTVRIAIILRSEGERSTRVTMTETPSRGIAGLLHNPAQDLLLRLRNVETLRRLERVAREMESVPVSCRP